MNILFTCVGRRVELVQCFRNAGRLNAYDLKIIATDCSEAAPALHFCDGWYIVPRIRDEGYIPALLDVCKKENIDLLIPTIDTDLPLLAENAEKFKACGTFVMVSSPDIIEKCGNKLLTYQLFSSLGLSTPKPCTDANEYNGGFPAFVKPFDGSGSVNSYRVNEQKNLLAIAERVNQYIVQPFVGGEEYSVDVMCDFNGNPIYITPRRRLEVRGGEVSKSVIVQDETIIEEAKRLVECMKPCGPITIQLIRDKATRKDCYIEINPRFGGGAPMSVYAGADSPSAVLKLLNNEKVEPKLDAAENGAMYARYDQSLRVDK